MDTRNKIVTVERAREITGTVQRGSGRVTVVAGYFDVLMAEHVRELRRLRDGVEKGCIIVVVTSPPEPVLSARARAEMVAALSVVDYVVIAEGGDSDQLLGAIAADVIVRGEIPDAERVRHLSEHVHRRQKT